jgi:hypothetical protein
MDRRVILQALKSAAELDQNDPAARAGSLKNPAKITLNMTRMTSLAIDFRRRPGTSLPSSPRPSGRRPSRAMIHFSSGADAGPGAGCALQFPRCGRVRRRSCVAEFFDGGGEVFCRPYPFSPSGASPKKGAWSGRRIMLLDLVAARGSRRCASPGLPLERRPCDCDRHVGASLGRGLCPGHGAADIGPLG